MPISGADSAETHHILGWGESIFLGALQGLGEFLPISSSGHLALTQYFLGMKGDALTMFDVVLHLGTLAAVLWYYRRRLFIPSAVPDDHFPDLSKREALFKLAIWLFLALLPAVAIKLAFRETKPGAEPTWRSRIGDLRERSTENPVAVLGFLACTSVILVVASRARQGELGVAQMTWRHALLIGMAQACSAMCPGLSRSGMTISTALLLGMRGPWAVNFSLLLSIPTILAAFVWESRHLTSEWIQVNWLPALAGTVVSAVVGWFSIGLLSRSVNRGHWYWFAIYLWIVVIVGGLALFGQSMPFTSNGQY